MSHGTRVDDSWHTYEWFVTHVCELLGCNMNESCHIYEWVMSHVWMSHVTRMNEFCHTYEWVILRIWMSNVTHMNESCHFTRMNHVTYMNESCHTYEWVMSHMNESCHTYEWVTSHIWMSHVTHIKCVALQHTTTPHTKASCHTYEGVMSHIWRRRVTHMKASCHTYERVTSLEHASFMCVTWLIHMCAMTHSHTLHDAFSCVPWLIHMDVMTHSYRCCDSFICVPWLIHLRAYTCRQEKIHVIHMNASCHTHAKYEWLTHVTHMNGSCHTYQFGSIYIDRKNQPHWLGGALENLRFTTVSCGGTRVTWFIHICDIIHMLVCTWKIDVWTAGKSSDLLREDSGGFRKWCHYLCVQYSNTRHFKKKHMAHPHLVCCCV